MSFSKPVQLDEKDPLAIHLRELHGTSNQPPKFIRRATLSRESGGLGQLGSYSIIASEYRQLYRPDDNSYWPFGNAPCAYGHYFFFYNETGIAYLWTGSDSNNPESGYAWWLVGCQHEGAAHKSTGNCQHQYTCKSCGFIWDVDSSG